MTNTEFVQGLRLIADFYEDNPEMPQFVVTIYEYSKEGFLRDFALLARNKAKITKNMGKEAPDSGYQNISIATQFGEIPFTVYTAKNNLCKKVVTWECPDSLLELALAEVPTDDDRPF